MTYSHIKQPGLLLVISLIGVATYYSNSQAASSHRMSVGYATHGLQVHVDPETGQFGKPPVEQATNTTGPLSLAQAVSKKSASVTLTERASARAGGGYSIGLQERYRPSRHGSAQGS